MVNKENAASPEQPSAPQEVSDDELTETELDAISGGSSVGEVVGQVLGLVNSRGSTNKNDPG